VTANIHFRAKHWTQWLSSGVTIQFENLEFTTSLFKSSHHKFGPAKIALYDMPPGTLRREHGVDEGHCIF